MKDINLSDTLPDGSPRYNKLSSGAIVDKTIGRIVTREQSSEQGRELVSKRWEKYRDAAASAMLKTVRAIDPSIQTEQEAWGYLYGKQFETLINSQKPRGDDLVKFGQVVGSMPTLADAKPQAVESEEDSEVVTALKALIEEITKRVKETPEVIEGNVSDL